MKSWVRHWSPGIFALCKIWVRPDHVLEYQIFATASFFFFSFLVTLSPLSDSLESSNSSIPEYLLISSARKSERISRLLRELHWLRVPERIRFRLCVFAFRCLHSIATSYIADSLRRAPAELWRNPWTPFKRAIKRFQYSASKTTTAVGLLK